MSEPVSGNWIEWPVTVMVDGVEATGVARAKWNDLVLTTKTPFPGLSDRDCRNGVFFGMATRAHPEKRFVRNDQPTPTGRQIAEDMLARLCRDALAVDRCRKEISRYIKDAEARLAVIAADVGVQRAPLLDRRAELRRAHKEGWVEQQPYQIELQEVEDALAGIGLERKAAEEAIDKAARDWSEATIGRGVPLATLQWVASQTGEVDQGRGSEGCAGGRWVASQTGEVDQGRV